MSDQPLSMINFLNDPALRVKAMRAQALKILGIMAYDEGMKAIKHRQPGQFTPEMEVMFEKQEAKAKALKSTHVLITVNPKGDDLAELMKKLSAFTNIKWVLATYLFCVEQRSDGTTPVGKGIHAHILVQRPPTVAPSTIKREAQRLFAKLVDNPTDGHVINFKFGDEKYAKNCYKYITGCKVSEAKRAKCDVDRQWRLDNGLQPYYKNGSQTDLGWHETGNNEAKAEEEADPFAEYSGMSVEDIDRELQAVSI